MNLNHYNASTRSYRMQMKSVEIDGARHSVKRGEPLYVERGAETIEIFPEIINYSVYKPYVSVYLEGYAAGRTVQCDLYESSGRQLYVPFSRVRQQGSERTGREYLSDHQKSRDIR